MLFGLAEAGDRRQHRDAVAFALFAFNVTDLGLALIPLVAILLLVGWSVGLVVIGLILRVGQGAEILAWGCSRSSCRCRASSTR